MAFIKKYLYILVQLLIYYLCALFWTYKFASIVYEDNLIVLHDINENTFKGVSLLLFIFIVIFSLLGAPITTILISNLLFSVFYYANNLKFIQRKEIINFNEIKEAVNIKELSNIVDLKTLFLIILISIVIIFILFVYERKILKKYSLPKLFFERLIILSILLLFLLSISQKSDIFAKRYFNVEQSRFVFNPILEIKRIGYIPYFVMNSSKSLMEKPYNKREIEEITNDYEKQSIQYNKTMANDIKNEHTIIYLSESFWQDKNVLNDKLPAPFINSLERKNGGKLISSYVGGGTANIEFEILTSMSLNLHNNPQTTSPYLDYFSKSNNHSSALNMVKKNTVIHPYTFGLYNRLQVYEDMEIKDLYDQNDMNNIKFLPGSGRASDETLHQFLIPKIKDYNMINLISMQNHSPYKYGVLKNNGYVPNILSGVFSVGESNNQYDDNINRAISYFKQIHETDRAIQSLLKHIDEERENINIIFYGDHAPSILNNKERLIGQVIYRTPFFIYQNNDRDNMKASSELSPIFIYPKLLSEGKYKVSPYYYLMIKLYDSGVQDIYGDKVLINGKSIKIEDIDVDIKRLVEDYKSINYYRYFTKQSINREFFEKYSK